MLGAVRSAARKLTSVSSRSCSCGGSDISISCTGLRLCSEDIGWLFQALRKYSRAVLMRGR